MSADTTAIQRLGHVFGWAGSITAALMMISCVAIIGYSVYGALNPKTTSGYEIQLDDGREFLAVGIGYSGDDAALAVKQHVGMEVPYGPYGDWKVFPIAGLTDAMRAEIELEREKVRAIQRASARREAWESSGIAGLFLFVPGIMVFLLGQALRYILAGPRKRIAV